jgi:hypothetical protein
VFVFVFCSCSSHLPRHTLSARLQPNHPYKALALLQICARGTSPTRAQPLSSNTLNRLER